MTWKNLNRKRFLRLHGFNRNRRLYIGKDKILEILSSFEQMQSEANLVTEALRQFADAATAVLSPSQGYYFDRELFVKYIQKYHGGVILCVSKK